MIQGAPAGPKLTMTSRLFLRRFLPRVVVQIEADVEAQQVVEALAACPDQTAVESDMKVAGFLLCEHWARADAASGLLQHPWSPHCI